MRGSIQTLYEKGADGQPVLDKKGKPVARGHEVRWRVGKKQKSKFFERKKDADRFLTATAKTIHDGTYRDVRPAPMVVVLDGFLKEMEVRQKTGELKPSTVKGYKSMIATHLRPTFSDYRSDQLSASVITDWRSTLADRIAAGTLAPKFYNNLLNLLHAILTWARKDAQGYLKHDPLADVKRLKVTTEEPEFLETDQIEALLDAAAGTDYTILFVAIYTGLRRGELFGLQWSDIEWGTGKGAGRLHVRRSIYQGAVTTPKTKTSLRVLDVPRAVLDVLAQHRTDCPPMDGEVIFRTATGTPIDPDNWSTRNLADIRVIAGLPTFGLHAARHTYASILIHQGENAKYVSRQMGHTKIGITLDLYGHLFKETSTAAMRGLDARITRAKAKANRASLTLVQGAA